MTAGRKLRGKSGLPLARVPGNTRRGQPQGKRHREETSTPTGGLPLQPRGNGETVG